MNRTLKKKVNLTIDEGLLDKAKRLAEFRGDSLSSLVEEFLAKLVSETEESEADWVSLFHRKYLGKTKEPTDGEVEAILNQRARRY